MKAFLKFSGFIAAGLAIVAFILMMATPALSYSSTTTVLGKDIVSTSTIGGMVAVFGGKYTSSIAGVSAEAEAKLGVMPLIAWILVLLGVLAMVALIILPMLKIKALKGKMGLITFIAAGLVIAGGVLMFFTLPSMNAANVVMAGDTVVTAELFKDYGLGAGWIISAILLIISGALELLPTVLGGKK